ncbi:MAG: glycoside hydrolase family 9 protein [Herpetosiphonaceae bacterium]|nr:glycoside hydrolase family 9 protein [Herpetosiphonaceae bacterium]
MRIYWEGRCLSSPTGAARLWLCLVALLGLSPLGAVGASGSAFIRVNQIGYITNGPKQALLMASTPENGAIVKLVDATGSTTWSGALGPKQGAWSSAFPYVYLLDFSTADVTGAYTLQVAGPLNAASPRFRIDSGANLYRALLPNALFFYKAQRDGPNVDPSVMQRKPSHLTDAQATLYQPPVYFNGRLQGNLTPIGGPLDVTGGWFDAGDYLKFVQTASYVDAAMLFGVREHPDLLGSGAADFASEARFGLDWLLKMWDDQTQTLSYQVGIGDGNNHIVADHDVWRLPQVDDQLPVQPGDANYYIKYRPVFRAGVPGSPVSPNLAGRLSASFGLCFQLFHLSDPAYAQRCLIAGEHLLDLAQTTQVGQLTTASPHDYYPETEWRDDLELGATELYLATASGPLPPGVPHADPEYYLQLAAHWAAAYIHGPNDGTDALNLYDTSGLAHYELARILNNNGSTPALEVTHQQLLDDLKLQLDHGLRHAGSDPFNLGWGYTDGDVVPHALGLSLEANWYDALTGTTTYTIFGQHQLDFVLGANSWGSSFIVGAGTTFPECMQHQVANLSGSLDGTPPIVLGATVDGPAAASDFSGLGVPSGARRCPPAGGDPFAVFNGHSARYEDNVRSWVTVEPTDDYTVLTILAFADMVGR